MRVAPKIVLADEQRTTLTRWTRGRATPARQVRRARIVLLAAEGRSNREIAGELGAERTIAGRWWRRSAEKGTPDHRMRDAQAPGCAALAERNPAGREAGFPEALRIMTKSTIQASVPLRQELP